MKRSTVVNIIQSSIDDSFPPSKSPTNNSRVRAKKVNCFTNRRLTNKTTIANKVIFKKSLLNSAYNNLSWKVNDSDAKTVSSICSVLLRSAGNFPKKGNDVVLSIDEVSCAFNKKAGECSGRLGGLQEQYAHNRIQSVQYNQPEEEQKYTGSDESHLDVSELDKENMNLSRRRNTVCSTTFKSLKNRGLMELGQANKNKDENLMKNSNLDNSKSIADPVAGLMQFRKLTMKKNIHLSIESKHNPWRKDRVYLKTSESRRKQACQMRKMTGSQENDKYFRDESVTIEWSILESTKMLIALFFNESPTILEKGIRDEATEMNIKIRKNQLPIEKQEQRKQQACDTDGPCLSIISLPRSPVDELDLGEFYLNHDRVFRYLFTQDLKSVSYYEADFLKRHRLTESVRATLCDWMIKVQQYLKLRTESLHLAVNLVDQYTWRRVTLYPSEYQLLGITAIFIAAKLIERFPPSTKTLCYLTENSYSSKQLLDLEFQVLKTLDFTINIPLPHHFLDRAVTACTDLTETGKAKAELICRYLFELSLTELSAVGILATVKCAASVYLARELLHLEYEAKKNKTNDIQSEDSANFILPNEFEIWPEVLGRSLGHESVITLLPMVLIYVKNIKPFLLKSNMPTEIYEAAFQKFSNRGYCRIALSTLLLEADYDAIVKDIKKQMKLNSAFS